MKYQKQTYTEERALYATKDAIITDCTFISEIGESPLKESQNLAVNNCSFQIRYPFWHDKQIKVLNCVLEANCRAPFWYDNFVLFKDSQIKGVKAFRESNNIEITNCQIESDEFGWFLHHVKLNDSSLASSYAFFHSTNIAIDKLDFTGKYAFQYAKDAVITNTNFKTKDAFWHSENVTVIDSIIEGEYLGWYAKNLKLINCTIKGTQPLCYAENVILENCKMIDADLAFEYSSVQATINSPIISVKNPLTGTIKAQAIEEIILDENRRDYDLVIEVEK